MVQTPQPQSKANSRVRWDSDKTCDNRSQRPRRPTLPVGDRRCLCRRSQPFRLERMMTFLVFFGNVGLSLHARRKPQQRPRFQALPFTPAASPSNLCSCLRFEEEDTAFLQLGKKQRPRNEGEGSRSHAAGSRIHIEAVHGLKVTPQDRLSKSHRRRRHSIVAFFNRVQGLRPHSPDFLCPGHTNAKRWRTGPSSNSRKRDWRANSSISVRDFFSIFRNPTTTSATCTPVLSM